MPLPTKEEMIERMQNATRGSIGDYHKACFEAALYFDHDDLYSFPININDAAWAERVVESVKKYNAAQKTIRRLAKQAGHADDCHLVECGCNDVGCDCGKDEE